MIFKYLRIARAPEGDDGVPDEIPAEEVPAEEVEAQTPEETSQETQPEAPSPAMVPADVFQRRVAALTRQKADLERRLELAELNRTVETPQTPRQPDVVTEAQALAQQIVFNQRANDVAAAGQKIAPDFLTKIAQMNAMHGELPTHFIEAVMEAGEGNDGAAELLYDLANDHARAAQILGMSPARQAVALAKLQAEKVGKKTQQPPIRKAQAVPAPITPKVGAGGAQPGAKKDIYDPKVSADDWMRLREQQIKEKRGY